jgi:prevent-host-death family protein
LGSWQVQDAKARFSEFLDATIKKGPQVVTRRGVKTAVLVQSKNGNGSKRPPNLVSRNGYSRPRVGLTT